MTRLMRLSIEMQIGDRWPGLAAAMAPKAATATAQATARRWRALLRPKCADGVTSEPMEESIGF